MSPIRQARFLRDRSFLFGTQFLRCTASGWILRLVTGVEKAVPTCFSSVTGVSWGGGCGLGGFFRGLLRCSPIKKKNARTSTMGDFDRRKRCDLGGETDPTPGVEPTSGIGDSIQPTGPDCPEQAPTGGSVQKDIDDLLDPWNPESPLGPFSAWGPPNYPPLLTPFPQLSGKTHTNPPPPPRKIREDAVLYGGLIDHKTQRKEPMESTFVLDPPQETVDNNQCTDYEIVVAVALGLGITLSAICLLWILAIMG